MVIVREHQESSNKSLKQKRLSLAFKKRKANIGDVTIQHIVNHESINLEECINTYGGCYNYSEETSIISVFVTPHTFQKYYQY